MPQMKGAGTTLAYIFPGLPYWAGVVLVGAVITLNVALGEMKGITLVQAFHYWAKMFAISVPIFVLMAISGHYGKQVEQNIPAALTSLSPVSASGLAPIKHLPDKAPIDSTWLSPFGLLTAKAAKAAHLTPEQSNPLSLLYTYSLTIALVCGTAGLPHLLVRF